MVQWRTIRPILLMILLLAGVITVVVWQAYGSPKSLYLALLSQNQPGAVATPVPSVRPTPVANLVGVAFPVVSVPKNIPSPFDPSLQPSPLPTCIPATTFGLTLPFGASASCQPTTAAAPALGSYVTPFGHSPTL